MALHSYELKLRQDRCAVRDLNPPHRIKVRVRVSPRVVVSAYLALELRIGDAQYRPVWCPVVVWCMFALR
jgi:hypothetical protein